MIDAYEIGIQLALQDGVSAGLAAIGRDLAEVDRAVAATTAGLQALTVAAQTASRAAAAVGEARVGTGAGQSAEAQEARPAAISPSREVPVSVPQSGLTEERGAALSGGSASSQGPAVPLPLSSASSPRPVERQPASPEVHDEGKGVPVVSPSAPVVIIQQRVSVAQSGVASPVAERVPNTAEPSAAPMRPRDDRQAVAAVPTWDRGVEAAAPTGSVSRERAITASVGKVFGSVTDAGSPAVPSAPRVELRSVTTQQPASRPSSVAWTGPTGQERAAGRTMGSERAAAPQPEARVGGGEAMSGVVMLDGRLVGQWMSDQMAREASRPPSGTTFFDPRQSPAWNASGAL